MMAHSVRFDTLQFANKLKQAGMDAKQAEVLAQLQADMVEDASTAHATKADIETLKTQISLKIATLEATLIKWMVGVSLGVVAAIVSLVKFVH